MREFHEYDDSDDGDPSPGGSAEAPGKRRRARRLVIAIVSGIVLWFLAWGFRSRDQAEWGTLAPGGGPPSLAGEFEHHETLFVALSASLQWEQRQSILSVARHASESMDVVMFVPPDSTRTVRKSLRDTGVDSGRIELIEAPLELCWVRDFGPVVGRDAQGSLRILDPIYDRPALQHCEAFPSTVGRVKRIPVAPVPLIMEGGNLLSNGKGLTLTTSATLDLNQLRLGVTRAEVEKRLKEATGTRELVVLEPLANELTGHVDMFVSFVSAGVVVVGQYNPEVDGRNAAILDRNAARLAQTKVDGTPLRVERIVMPPRRNGLWYTYTNVTFANRQLLVPSYRGVDSQLERQAFDVYQRLLPDRKIVAVEAEALLRDGGSLHCATLGVLQNLRGTERE